MQKRVTPLGAAITLIFCLALCWLEAADLGFMSSMPLVGLLVELVLLLPALYFSFAALRRDVFSILAIAFATVFSVFDAFRCFFSEEADSGRLLLALASAVAAVSSINKLVTDKAKPMPSDTAKALSELLPETGTVLRDGAETKLPVSEILPGDIVAIRPGETVPCDGEIIAGMSELDENLLRGELSARFCSEGDSVRAGSVNISGFLTVRASGDPGDLAGLTESYNSAVRPPFKSFSKKFIRIYRFAAPAAAVLCALAAMLSGGADTALFYFTMIFALLCPCGLSAAEAFGGLAAARKSTGCGLVIRDISAFERLKSVTAAVIDRTGTATVGKLAVTDILPLDDVPEDGIIRLAAALSVCAAGGDFAAIAERCRILDIPIPPCISPERLPGKIIGTVDGRRVELSSLKEDCEPYLSERPELSEKELRALILGGRAVGLIALRDSVKPNAVSAIGLLSERGIRSVLVTGGEKNAERDAFELGIETYCTDMSPEDKLGYVVSLQKSGETVAFIAEGTGDCAALRGADCGIALASGDSAARDAASVLLLRNDLRDLIPAIRLSALCLTAEKISLIVTASFRAAFTAAAATVCSLVGSGAGAVICSAGLILSVLASAAASGICLSLKK